MVVHLLAMIMGSTMAMFVCSRLPSARKAIKSLGAASLTVLLQAIAYAAAGLFPSAGQGVIATVVALLFVLLIQFVLVVAPRENWTNSASVAYFLIVTAPALVSFLPGSPAKSATEEQESLKSP